MSRHSSGIPLGQPRRLADELEARAQETQAEPALDLGQFLAYARVAVPKARHKEAPPAEHITEEIGSQFLDTYIAASASSRSWSEERLRARVPVDEAISLLRIALRSWQKLKGPRLEYVISVLEERI